MMHPLRQIRLDSEHCIFHQRLPDHLVAGDAEFERLWQLHPPAFPTIFLHGRQVRLPRWQQAYGRSYVFSGKTSRAQPVPQPLTAYLHWARRHLDRRLNGMLLNWYDGQAGHYIGEHRDSTTGLMDDSPIVMISLGGARVMRFRSMDRQNRIDIEVNDADVIIMPMATNRAYKHGVPRFKRHRDKRISITLRCFDTPTC